jgi:hypothetical protein
MTRRKQYSDRCWQWDACLCGRTWLHWQNRMEEWEIAPPSAAELEKAEEQIFHMLWCVADTCPDAKFRRKALRELRQPTFRRQHRIVQDEHLEWLRRRWIPRGGMQ